MKKVLIAGGTGLVGTRLSQLLTEAGYEVVHLSQRKRVNALYPTFVWDVKREYIEEGTFEGVAHIINLAGAGIADSLWTKNRKKVIIDSRVQTTALLAKTIQKLDNKPKTYLSAAAIGIYGNRGEEQLTEQSMIGKEGFLVETCVAWEQAIQAFSETTNIRTLIFRVGIVLSTRGGALEKMMLPLKFFTANYFGNGQQWYAWIHIDDLCRMFIKGIEMETMSGIYNATAPNPLRNKTLMQQLLKTLDKRALLMPTPASVLKMGMGAMSAIVLDSSKVIPERIQKTDFEFLFPNFPEAIKDLVNRKL